MPRLTPNAPAKRLEWVLKTYWPKYTIPVTDTFVVAMHLLGLETGDLRDETEEASIYATGAVIERKDRAAKIRGMLAPVLDILASVRNENDFLIPWIAKQLVDLYRAMGGDDALRNTNLAGGFADMAPEEAEDDEIDDVLLAGLADAAAGATHSDYNRAVETLKAKGTAIAMWARETKRDLGRVTLAQALEAIADYEFKTRLVSQGTVVYSFPDGYTIQELRTAPELKAEGEVMQHCVGSYCEQVAGGESRIYSLRDAHGNPHVTMEWQVDQTIPDDAVTGERMPLLGHFVQIYGKQNDPPAEKYKPYVQQFIREKFDADPRSMLLAGAKARDLKLAGADLRGVDLKNVDLSGTYLLETDFREADLIMANLNGAWIERALFDGATMAGADLTGAHAEGASFISAGLGQTIWRGTHIADANFRNAFWGPFYMVDWAPVGRDTAHYLPGDFEGA